MNTRKNKRNGHQSKTKQLADALSASPEFWAFALSYAIAIAVVFFDVTIWRT